MDSGTLKMLKDLCDAPGVPGYEDEVRKVVRKYLPKGVKTSCDALGSIVCEKAGSSERPRIMIPGHMDEIGFMVKIVTDDGFVKFQPLGGWWDQVLLGQKVAVYGSKGPVTGLIGSKPPHILPAEERSKVVQKKNMFIDVGAGNKKEVEKYGIRPGDPIVPVFTFEKMKNPKLLMAKAWDDRVGVGLFISVLKKLQKVRHANTVYGVGTVQEEVGTRGAKTSAYVVDPDVCLVAEVGISGDVPGIKPDEAQGELGGGVQICIHDSGMIPHRGLRDFVLGVAKKEKIKTQICSLAGGATDGRPIHLHKGGVPTIYLGVPTRYIHTHGGILHADDYDAAVKLVVAVCRRLDSAALKKILPKA